MGTWQFKTKLVHVAPLNSGMDKLAAEADVVKALFGLVHPPGVEHENFVTVVHWLPYVSLPTALQYALSAADGSRYITVTLLEEVIVCVNEFHAAGHSTVKASVAERVLTPAGL